MSFSSVLQTELFKVTVECYFWSLSDEYCDCSVCAFGNMSYGIVYWLGYKMFGRVYLNGDGGGRSTHLSLFVVVARGNFDALLRWPFTQRVTLTLLDQVAGRQHVTEAFRPDRSSAAAQRPVADTNVATGFPRFVPLASLDGPQSVYVRDDTMYIRISVDCRDL